MTDADTDPAPRPGAVPDERIPGAATAFGPAAVDYEQSRPTYPSEAIECLRQVAGLGDSTQVIDLAAGTGKLTRLLLATGADVIAVEPVPGMRDELAAAVPGVVAIDGTAESIPLPDASADLVTVAQAFHWFRFEEALAEIARVLRPGGHLSILFNERDHGEPWVAEWSRVIEWHRRTISVYQATDWTSVLQGGGFVDVGNADFAWLEPMDRGRLASRVRSVSYVAEQSAEVQAGYVDKVLDLVKGFPDQFEVPYLTHVWWARKP